MARFYALHLSRHVQGMVKGPVRAVPAQGVVFDLDDDFNCVVADREAIGHCLPSCYRKAWERCVSTSQISGQDGFHYALYDRKGKWINTVYAIPYDYTPTANK